MMTPSVIVLQHVPPEGPGGIGDALQAHGVGLRIVRIDRGEPVPAQLDAAGLVVMGGPMGVYEADRYPHLRDELHLIEAALRAERPIVGVCLGSQLLAAALGARVYPSGYQEIGWYPVELAEAAGIDPLLHGLPPRFTALHWHGDVFDLPAGAVRLAASELTPRQAFRWGEHVHGLLFHLEMTPAQLTAMVDTYADELAAGPTSARALLDGAATHLAPLQAIGARVFERFADSVARASRP